MSQDIEAYITTKVDTTKGTEKLDVWTNDCPIARGVCRDDDIDHRCRFYQGVDTVCGYTTVTCAAEGE